MGECNSCHKVVLITPSDDVCPNPFPQPVDDRVPDTIRKDFEEALKCFSISAFRASAVMARRALQSICLDKGAKEDERLEKQIDFLFAQGIITSHLKEWAHEVRLVGNDAAHPQKPDKDQPVTKDDAEDILLLLKQFTNVLYVAPAIAEERRKSRSKTK